MRRGLLPLMGLLLLWPVTGCSPGKGSVRGTVTYQDKPYRTGSVTLIAADGSRHDATINPQDGTYELFGVPAGPATFIVVTHDGLPPGFSRGQAQKPKVIPLPPRYSDPATSGFTLVVKSGSQFHDLPMKP